MISRRRRGFTLVETVFAIFIFALGALCFAATTAVMVRALAEAGVRERATRVAANRLETQRGFGCGVSGSGSEIVQGIRSTWTSARSGAMSSVVSTASYSLSDGPRAESYSLLFYCPP